MSDKVFVYGTLKRGFGNHEYLLSKSKFLGEHVTDPAYTMVSCGGFPGVIESGSTPITGEVFEVTEEELLDCDRLEGHPNWYRRKLIPTPYGEAWVYIYPSDKVEGLKVVESGVWRGRMDM